MDVRESADIFDDNNDNAAGAPPAPKTTTVVLLLVVAAATFSYLGAYAVTGALVSQGIIAPLPRDPDPRLRWALTAFAGMMLTFGAAALALRQMSRRQFSRIDRMNDAENGG